MGVQPKEVQRPDLQPEWREPGFPSTCFSLLMLFLFTYCSGRDHLIAALKMRVEAVRLSAWSRAAGDQEIPDLAASWGHN